MMKLIIPQSLYTSVMVMLEAIQVQHLWAPSNLKPIFLFTNTTEEYARISVNKPLCARIHTATSYLNARWTNISKDKFMPLLLTVNSKKVTCVTSVMNFVFVILHKQCLLKCDVDAISLHVYMPMRCCYSVISIAFYGNSSHQMKFSFNGFDILSSRKLIYGRCWLKCITGCIFMMQNYKREQERVLNLYCKRVQNYCVHTV